MNPTINRLCILLVQYVQYVQIVIWLNLYLLVIVILYL
jgi:hypothetical protein